VLLSTYPRGILGGTSSDMEDSTGFLDSILLADIERRIALLQRWCMRYQPVDQVSTLALVQNANLPFDKTEHAIPSSNSEKEAIP
jgi:hypothetical protein